LPFGQGNSKSEILNKFKILNSNVSNSLGCGFSRPEGEVTNVTPLFSNIRPYPWILETGSGTVSGG